MSYFLVSLRKYGEPTRHFFRPAYTASSAYDLVASEQGNEVFGITVRPV